MLEVIEAAFAGEHRRKNAEQTRDRMRARCLNGYWCLQLPAGYRYYKVRGQGALIERNEPCASILQEALEGYACGHLETQAEVARFLQKHPEFPRNAKGYVTDQKAHDILTNSLYAGYVVIPNWDVSLRKGHHPALISMETHLRIQERLNGKPKAPARRDVSADFPLRGFVICDDCGTPLTSCWAKGRSTRYAYYHCPAQGCPSYGKSIKRDEIEGQFAEILATLTPSPELAEVAHGTFRILWQEQANKAEDRKARLAHELRKIERDVEVFLDKIVDADGQSIVRAYENRINELEARKAETAERIAKLMKKRRDQQRIMGYRERVETAARHWENKEYDLAITTMSGLLASPQYKADDALIPLPLKTQIQQIQEKIEHYLLRVGTEPYTMVREGKINEETVRELEMMGKRLENYVWNYRIPDKNILIGQIAGLLQELRNPPVKSYAGTEPFLFVSYAHADKVEVFKVLKALDAEKIRFWYDEGITITSNWETMIIQRIDQAQAMLVFISPATMKSVYCLNELLHAMDTKKKLIPIYLQPTELDERLKFRRLGDIQGLQKFELTEMRFAAKLLEAVGMVIPK